MLLVGRGVSRADNLVGTHLRGVSGACLACRSSDQVAAWLPKAATVNNLSSSALQALHFVF
jgi:hypothetical protein